ncbi:MAG: PA14 domain-containing protein [Phycisphaerales bacterium]
MDARGLRKSVRTLAGVAWALAAMLMCTSASASAPAIRVYWYENTGAHSSLDTIDWSSPDRMTRAEIIHWPSTGAPWEPGAPQDYYALHLVSSIRAQTAGLYEFRLGSDDGSRLHINDELVVDNDGLHGMVYQTGSILLSEGTHPFEIHYFERTGGAGLHLEWRPPGAGSWETVPASAFTDPEATVWLEWYELNHPITRLQDVSWANPTRQTVESQINWELRTGSGFLPDGPDTRFALRARTRLQIPETGIYRLELGSDDGSRLSVAGQVVIDQNRTQDFAWHSAEILLTEGTVAIEVLYFQNLESAGLVLMWQRPSDTSPEVIPPSSFLAPDGASRPRVTRWSEQPRRAQERRDLP